MYKWKNSKKFCTRTGKSVALLISVLLIVCIAMGTTIAFLMDDTETLDNTFTPSNVTTIVVEDFDGTTKSDVQIQNTGNTDAWIRAAVLVTWQDAEGSIYGKMPVADDDYIIEWGDEGWLLGTDGFYYWNMPVAANDGTTGNLIDSCTNDKTITVGENTYYLTVEIIGSGIQCKPSDVFSVWESSGLTVNDADPDHMKWTLEQ